MFGRPTTPAVQARSAPSGPRPSVRQEIRRSLARTSLPSPSRPPHGGARGLKADRPASCFGCARRSAAGHERNHKAKGRFDHLRGQDSCCASRLGRIKLAGVDRMAQHTRNLSTKLFPNFFQGQLMAKGADEQVAWRDGAMAMGMEQMIAPLHTPKPRPRAPLTPPPPSPADLAGRWSATGRMVCEWQACWSVRRQLSAASRKSRVRSLARRLRTSLGAGQGGWCGCLHVLRGRQASGPLIPGEQPR
jgi:hypothetical protein